jgi:cell division protein ZapA
MNPLVSEKVRVEIFGKQYEIDPGGLTPLEASQLASFVDRKMREIADSLHLVDTQKIAVLAALNIAFEMGQELNKENVLGAEGEKKVEEMLSVLDHALQ